MHLQMGEEQRQQGHDDPHHQAAQHAAQGVADQDGVRRQWRDHQLFDGTLKFAAEETRHHVAVGVGDHRHHDQPRHDVLHVGEATHVADLPTDQVTEDHEVQDHGDGWRQQGLRPDPGETPDFTVNDGVEGNEVGAQLGTHTATFDRFFSTRDTNNSSRRLVLLRRLSTSMFCCANWVNSAVMPMDFSTWTSRVWLSISRDG
ncbi:hypothetical protein D3C72_1163530 [compost metagenome]